VNLLWFGQAAAVTEALLLGRSLGLDPATLLGVFRRSAAGSAFLDGYGGALLDGDVLPAFGIDRVVEELDTLTALAEEASAPFELSTSVARLHRAGAAAVRSRRRRAPGGETARAAGGTHPAGDARGGGRLEFP
jgi:3-hydroxyisobutyrate dehydrogenase-like beta-hydroxyacid dehydrogenase